MEQKGKLLTYFYLGVGMVILVALGVLLGAKLEQYTAEKEKGIDNSGMIAVVNLDTGATVDGVMTNYASGLISLPSEHFTYTSLEVARQGVSDGTYAAYILIPENFSKSVASVETVPENVNIQYEINPGLREEVLNQVIGDIHAFEVNLNSNISYMYITAIMTEFHKGQDAAETIMENDNKELEVINAIQPEELLAELAITEATYPENTIEYKDFSALLLNNRSQIAALREYHASCVEQAKAEFATIKAGSATMQSAMEAVKLHLTTMNLSTDANGNLIYQEGLTNLEQEIAGYQTTLETEKKAIKEAMGWSKDENDVESYATPAAVQSALEQSVNTNAQAYNAQLSQSVTDINQCIANLHYDDVTGEIVGLDDLQAAVDGIPAFTMDASAVSADAFRPWQEGIVQAVDAMTEPDSDAWHTMFTEQVIQVVLQKATEESTLLAQESEAAVAQMDSYADGLQNFDPFQYVDDAQISNYLTAIDTNVSTVETDVNATTFEQQIYVTDLYSAVLANETAWRTNMDTAYNTTAGNVNTTVTTLKQSRTTMNALNVELLSEFSKQLSNTRLGKVEYTQLYDIVSHPLLMQNVNPQAKLTVEARDYNTILLVAVGALAIWAVCGAMWQIVKRAGSRRVQDE